MGEAEEVKRVLPCSHLRPDCLVSEMQSTGFLSDVGLDGAILKTVNGGIPVELTSFTASYQDNAVNLNWITATETNNKGFEVERKKGADEYEKIGYVEGSGTTTKPVLYSFADRNVESGKYLYRLKQIDFDGSYKLSGSVEVSVNLRPQDFALYQNYPNPFNPGTIIEFKLPEDVNNVKLSVYNALGEKVVVLVNTGLKAGTYHYQWNAHNVAAGMYFYELKTDKFVSVKKMIHLK